MDQLARTPRTTLKRLPQRGSYERATIAAILDAGLVCHVGFAVDGEPFVIPTIYTRIGDRLYFHGSAASRTLRALDRGGPVCVSVTLTDGLEWFLYASAVGAPLAALIVWQSFRRVTGSTSAA